MTKLNVLIADLDYLFQQALKKVLSEDQRFTVFETDGEQKGDLVDLCSRYMPDILFTDILENGEPSSDPVKKVCQAFPSIRVYIFTNYSEFHLIQELMRSGIADYLLLPLSLAQLSALLNEVEKKASFNTLTDKIALLLTKQNFEELYRNLPVLANEIQQSFKKDSQSVNLQLEKVISVSLKLIHCTNPEQQARYRQKLTFSRDVIEDDLKLQFMLFDYFDELYKQRTIQKRPQMSQVFHYIERTIYQDISLAATSDACGISQGYLSRVMKEQYGFGFNQYIQMKKIQLAKQAFYFNHDKVIDVAFQLSYNEPSYFTKVFKRVEKMSPNQFKKKLMGNG
ncbi:DNA-binding response regulator [Sporolactobacillus shoreicorticis]|uniref:Helix-turn-helix domain-containing protein n=1 Tax=Sporolactobacillus shoreicorticis TaxID=1923877 RepID=A0ABW5S3K2_9BACL|nr:DNA-binding response regulator [Sporolactobacillus shoreicorticis]MCO7124445.1 DNA-binding response regulator [Sporolactobacillus shoreicorticis]